MNRFEARHSNGTGQLTIDEIAKRVVDESRDPLAIALADRILDDPHGEIFMAEDIDIGDYPSVEDAVKYANQYRALAEEIECLATRQGFVFPDAIVELLRSFGEEWA